MAFIGDFMAEEDPKKRMVMLLSQTGKNMGTAGHPLSMTPPGIAYRAVTEGPAVIGDLINTFKTPGDIAMGRKPATVEDAARFALDVGLGGFGASAPKGALRSGAAKDAANIEIFAPYGRGVDGTYIAKVNGKEIGRLNISPRGPYASSVEVNPGFQRKGVASALYAEAEKDLGRKMIPSPMGLSDSAMSFWKKRLSTIPYDEVQAMLKESADIGASAGIPKSANNRMISLGMKNTDDILATAAPPIAPMMNERDPEAEKASMLKYLMGVQ